MARARAITASSRLHAVAAACVLVGLPSAQAAVVVGGSYSTDPAGVVVAPGDLGDNTALYIGNLGTGTFLADGGSLLNLGRLTFATGLSSTGTGTISGAGTLVTLRADFNRLEVGNWGTGSLTVTDGALLNARDNLQGSTLVCQTTFCSSFIGNGAGSTGTLTVSNGGRVQALQQVFVGHGAVFTQAGSGFDFGTPGGTTRGTVNLLSGGVIVSDQVVLGSGPTGPDALGTERSIAEVNISGAGSSWRVVGSPGFAASLRTALHPNAEATVMISNGGRLRVVGPADQLNFVNLGQGGRSDVTVTGTGSAIEFQTPSSVLQVGRSGAQTQSTLRVLEGAQVTGTYYTSIGRDGATGTLTVDGAGSLMRVNGNSFAASTAAGGSFVGLLDVGRDGGNGNAVVSNGGRIEVQAALGLAGNTTGMNVGRGANTTGALRITGGGSVVQFDATSSQAGGGPAETFNPLVRIGTIGGTGSLQVDNGGKLLMNGAAVSTVADPRSTSLYIGGTSSTGAQGGNGTALVTGAGSEITLTGTDRFTAVGFGPNAIGQLTVANQGRVNSGLLHVGRTGTGTLNVDNATISLTGQFAGGSLAGASLGIGLGGGTGTANLSNGALVRIDNAAGTSATGVTIGGGGNLPLGQGTLNMSGGSRIEVVGPARISGMTVGRDGSGTANVSGGSSVDLGYAAGQAGGVLQIGRNAGGSGTMTLAQSSSLAADLVLIARVLTDPTGAGTTAESGGSGALLVNSNSTVTANRLEIGSGGLLGGNGGRIQASVVNAGTINPGNSPGTLTIDGSYTNQGGRVVLEIESNGMGGFVTDQLVFTQPGVLDFGGLDILFAFLGDTDPLAFLASGGFELDTFLKAQDGQGNLVDLSSVVDEQLLFSTTSFDARSGHFAITSFTFDAVNGATGLSVPEPTAGSLLLIAALAGFATRRRRVA
jgi:T5SS/PEP-CTERM-associated repeat protein